jgi:hypothetical protein
MIEHLTSRLADPDMQAAPAALLRAALRARELARQTGSPLVIMRDGELVEEPLKEQAIVPDNELKDRYL